MWRKVDWIGLYEGAWNQVHFLCAVNECVCACVCVCVCVCAFQKKCVFSNRDFLLDYTVRFLLGVEGGRGTIFCVWQTVIDRCEELCWKLLGNPQKCFLLGSSGRVVNSLDFYPTSLKSLGCFYFWCVLASQWKAVTVNLQSLHCQL